MVNEHLFRHTKLDCADNITAGIQFSGEFKGPNNPQSQLLLHSAVLLHSVDVTTSLFHGWVAQISSISRLNLVLGGGEVSCNFRLNAFSWRFLSFWDILCTEVVHDSSTTEASSEGSYASHYSSTNKNRLSSKNVFTSGYVRHLTRFG